MTSCLALPFLLPCLPALLVFCCGSVRPIPLYLPSLDCLQIDFTIPTAIIFGNEKTGVSPEALAMADLQVKIPMSGFSESFNVSVAAALAFYQAREDRIRRQVTRALLSLLVAVCSPRAPRFLDTRKMRLVWFGYVSLGRGRTSGIRPRRVLGSCRGFTAI